MALISLLSQPLYWAAQMLCTWWLVLGVLSWLTFACIEIVTEFESLVATADVHLRADVEEAVLCAVGGVVTNVSWNDWEEV